jgi:hypothetical protein
VVLSKLAAQNRRYALRVPLGTVKSRHLRNLHFVMPTVINTQIGR